MWHYYEYIPMNVNRTVVGQGANAAATADRNYKQMIFKNYSPFTDSIRKINNTQVNNSKDHDIVMPMYNLIEYSDNYVKTTWSLCQYCRDEPDDGNIKDLKHLNLSQDLHIIQVMQVQ